ncbi:MAG: hypothetical protein KKC19_01230 [Nanoarchaeota archaeon]|nr:hypothetical protein [Nanoarchaeota archaeon]
MKAKIGKSYLTEILHEGGKINFQYPSFRGNYGNVAEKIDAEGLQRPNSSETALLVYDAFQNPEGKYESEIIDILNKGWFWEFTGNLYIPKSNEEINNGVILENNPKIINGRLAMDKDSLINRLQEGDSNVQFVPFGFKAGEQTSRELEKNPYVVARYGEEGAEKIAEIADKYRRNPRVWAFDSVDEKIQRVSVLYREWGFGDRIGVDGNGRHHDGGGCAFGVVPNKGE